jgi:drug/metabolite transporter (DMT)-like permease
MTETRANTISIISHILWGFHPVCARYLQTRPTVPLDGINLLAVVQMVAFLVNLASSTLSTLMAAGSSTSNDMNSGESENMGDKEPMLPRHIVVDVESSSNKNELGTGFEDEKANVAMENSVDVPLFSKFTDVKTLRIISSYVTFAALTSTTNMSSTSFTFAYNIQVISMAGPLITALVSYFMLSEVLPWTLWPCIFFTGCGEIIVLLAQAGILQLGEATYHPSVDYDDFIGIALQMVSLVCNAFSRVLMVTTQSSFSPSQLMGIQYVLTSIPIMIWSTFLNYEQHWQPWLSLDFKSFVMVSFFAIGVYKFAAELQVVAIRELGPGAHSAYQPLRLVSTLLGSFFLLEEKINNPLELLGLLIVFLTLVWYLTSGKQCGLETDITGKKSVSAKVASTKSRWWFQRLCWPRPSHRLGKKSKEGISSPPNILEFESSSSRTMKSSVELSHHHRHRRRLPQEIKENRREKMRQARNSKVPKRVYKMLREEDVSEDSSEESEDDRRLLGKTVDLALLSKKKLQIKKKKKSSSSSGSSRGSSSGHHHYTSRDQLSNDSSHRSSNSGRGRGRVRIASREMEMV